MTRETVKIGKKDFDAYGYLRGNWYTCPNCNGQDIFEGFDFCPECGVKLEWEDKEK